MPMSTAVMGIFALCVCLVCVVIAVAIYYSTQSEDTSSPSASPSPSPAARDPRATVWTTGQLLQSAPLEIGTAVVPLSPQPTLPATATYSISMDLNIAATHTTWRCILESVDGVDWINNMPKPNARRPLIGITGNDALPADQIFLNHTDASSVFQGDGLWANNARRQGADYTLGKWFNWTATVDSSSKTAKIYVDGILKGSFAAAQPFAWPNPVTTWTWNNSTYSKTSSIKVANAYFFPSVLTDAQVASLKVPTSPTAGVDTTSYYTSEPMKVSIEGYSLN